MHGFVQQKLIIVAYLEILIHIILMYQDPRDIFFKGELTGEALERSLEKKRQRAEEKSHMEKEKNIKLFKY